MDVLLIDVIQLTCLALAFKRLTSRPMVIYLAHRGQESTAAMSFGPKLQIDAFVIRYEILREPQALAVWRLILQIQSPIRKRRFFSQMI